MSVVVLRAGPTLLCKNCLLCEMIMLQGFVKVFHEFENDTLIEGIK